MKPRNTIIVLVILALLAGYVYYDQQQSASAPTATPVPQLKVLDLNPDDVTGIQVTTPVSRTLAHKDNNVWQMDEPSKEEADTARLNNLVKQFARLTATRALTETPSDLAQYGLVTGTLTMTLQLKDNRSEVVRFGDPAVGSTSYFAQHISDPKVYLISPSVYGDLRQLLDMPPKKPTPTPTPLPTNTPLPTTPTPVSAQTPAATDTPKP